MTWKFNKTRLHNYLILCFLVASATSHAQFWLSNEDLHQEANEFYEAEEYTEALPLFQLLEKKEDLTPNIQYKMGDCYLNIQGQKHLAIPYLEQAIVNSSCTYEPGYKTYHAPLDAYLVLSIAYRIDRQFDKALSILSFFRGVAADCDSNLMPVIDLQVNRCKIAKSMSEGKKSYIIDTLALPNGINNPYNAIMLPDSTLFFMNELKFYDALNVSHYMDGHWQQSENLTPRVGSDGDHILVDVSDNGKQLLFYGYDPMASGEIFMARKADKGWTKVEKVGGVINTPFNETHASFCESLNGIFFTSNRDGGLGGSDIYFAEAAGDNIYVNARNLGYPVNTPYDDIAPYYNSADSSLYFCSQGHMNMGGFDVFVSARTADGNWSVPRNLGSPVSTPDDDIFYFPTGKFSGVQSLQLNRWNSEAGLAFFRRIDSIPQSMYLLEGVANINDTLCGDAFVSVINKLKADTVSVVKVGSDGGYSTMVIAGSYHLVVADSCGVLASEDINIDQNNPLDRVQLDFPLLAADNAVTESDKVTDKISGHDVEPVPTKDTLILHDIYFAFDEVQIKKTDLPFLDSIAKNIRTNNILKLTIEGHTDSKGPEAYNLYLSERRAQNVAKVLENNGVISDLITIIGKGESDPKALSTNAEGADLTEGRKYNRRVRLVLEPNPSKIVLIIVDDVPAELKIK